jgi:fumarylacetoacetase
VAIGDQILDLAALGIKTGPTLNGLAAMGRGEWKRLRRTLSQGLSLKKRNARFARHLLPMKQAELFLPMTIGDYTDFFTGIHHATNMGRMLRPGQSAAAELQVAADRLPRAQLVDRGFRAPRCCARAGRSRRPTHPQPVFRSKQEAGLRGRARLRRRSGQRARETQSRSRTLSTMCSGWCCSRLVGARRAGVGIPTARAVPRQELRHHHSRRGVVTRERSSRIAARVRAPPGDPQPLPYLWDEDDQREGGFSIEVEMHLRSEK